MARKNSDKLDREPVVIGLSAMRPLRRLAFSVIHRAAKDIEDLEARAIKNSGLCGADSIEARRIYQWFTSPPQHPLSIGSFAWWAHLAKQGNSERLLESGILKARKSYFRISGIKNKTIVDNSLVDPPK